jgi:hypothetical protein
MRIDGCRIHRIEGTVPRSRSESHERATMYPERWHSIADRFLGFGGRRLNRPSQGMEDAPDRLRLCREIGIDAAAPCRRVGPIARRAVLHTARGSHRASFPIENERRATVRNQTP